MLLAPIAYNILVEKVKQIYINTNICNEYTLHGIT